MTDEIAYERAGSGEPLLLIHGLGGTRGIWDPIIDHLVPHREVITIDMPGFGDSPVLPDGIAPTAENLAATIAGLCRRLGIAQPHVAGNSLGGWVALEMARFGAAASLGLISPAGLWGSPLGSRNFDSQSLAKRFRGAIKLALRNEGLRHRMLSSTVGKPEKLSYEDALTLVSGWVDAPGYEAANEEMRRKVFERPDEIEVPTTVIWGDRDRLVRMPAKGRLPEGTRMIVLEGAGHTPTWDAPEELAGLLLEASSAVAV